MAGLENKIVGYDNLYNKFREGFKNHHYLFEITKCCGYSEFVSCTKEDSLKKLFDNIATIFCNKQIKLFTILSGEKVWIPPSSDISVKEYIREMNLKPEYPLPCEIVYKIYIDDGHCIVGHQDYTPTPFVTFTCKFHENKIENKNK